MRKNALFISQNIFLEENAFNGGVSLCTKDYIRILSSKFNLINFPVIPLLSLSQRILNKFGLIGYLKFVITEREKYKIKELIIQNEIEYIFFNHSYISDLARVVKIHFPNMKIILCSHGNESGDFLHDSTRYHANMSIIPRFFRKRKLGLLLTEEVGFRRDIFDVVITVSEIEESIEKWLGTKNVIFIPRVFSEKFIEWLPIKNRVGFISDLSHEPNFISVLKFCHSVNESELKFKLKLRLVGKEHHRYNYLINKYPFVEYLGYLSEDEIIIEFSTWCYFLNLLDYSSKGVSTKLAYGMNFGIPVISTRIGCRGYYFKDNRGPKIVETIDNIVEFLDKNIDDPEIMKTCRDDVRFAVNSFSDPNQVMDLISSI